MSIAPYLLYRWARPHVAAAIREQGGIDLIDGHYLYPDGVAAVMLGRYFDVPVVVTARGSDVNVLPEYRGPRKWIEWALTEADGLIAVSNDLKTRMVALGAPESKTRFLRNGVDLEFFSLRDRAAARQAFGVDGPCLASVGNLISLKGHDLVIEALANLPACRLLIVGDGPMKQDLVALAERSGVSDRVVFLGRLPQEKMPQLYSAIDILVLASSSEGWANVLLETMACGTPVVATNVSGNPEVVVAAEAGVLIPERTPAHIVQAVSGLLANPPDRSATRTYAEGFSWEATTQGQIDLFTEILSHRKAETTLD